MTDDVGVIHGRFQPVHLDHVAYLLDGYDRCETLVVGITCPDSKNCLSPQVEPERGLGDANPFTYYERLQMVTVSLVSEGVPRSSFDVVPFPFSSLDVLDEYVPQNATFYVGIYDDWEREKRDMLEANGVPVDVLWERSPSEKFTTGTEVRKKMANGEDWQSLVPDAVESYVSTNDLVDRLRIDDHQDR